MPDHPNPLIRIEATRERLLDQDELAEFESFAVIDNGSGFNDANYDSFETVDTQYKQQFGGKGLGRFSWLKALIKSRSTVITVTVATSDTGPSNFFHARRKAKPSPGPHVRVNPAPLSGLSASSHPTRKVVPESWRRLRNASSSTFCPSFLTLLALGYR